VDEEGEEEGVGVGVGVGAEEGRGKQEDTSFDLMDGEIYIGGL